MLVNQLKKKLQKLMNKLLWLIFNVLKRLNKLLKSKILKTKRNLANSLKEVNSPSPVHHQCLDMDSIDHMVLSDSLDINLIKKQMIQFHHNQNHFLTFPLIITNTTHIHLTLEDSQVLKDLNGWKLNLIWL
jgi:hypothetical protein